MKPTAKKIPFKPVRLTAYEKEAASLVRVFLNNGFETYVVGGAVRDMLLGVAVNDIDLATAANPENIKKVLKKNGYKFFTMGEKFGTISALVSKNRVVEITTFRTESQYFDSRHPSKVEFQSDIALDIQRRDFTINALLYNPIQKEILDYTDGYKDIKTRRLRFIGSPAERIKEDPLRMLRAVRFLSTLNFKLTKIEKENILKNSNLIKKVSGKRTKQELDKMFLSENFVLALKHLEQLQLLKSILPEVDNLKKVVQSSDVHAEGDAFIHTTKVFSFMKNESLDLKYAALFHDIGKLGTASKRIVKGRNRISFFNHAQLGANRFIEIATRLKFSKNERNKIHYLILHHMDLLHLEEVNTKTLIKWAQKPHFEDLIKLRLADTKGSFLTTRSGKPAKRDLSDIEKLFRLAAKSKQVKRRKIITGDEVMRFAGVKEGRVVGNILSQIESMQIGGEIKSKKDAIKFLKSLDKTSYMY
jgi:tRNA nucleotidyltransferase/poly(A) polymerase